MSIKLDLSENITGYKEDLDKDLQTLETEINSISISLNIMSYCSLLHGPFRTE